MIDSRWYIPREYLRYFALGKPIVKDQSYIVSRGAITILHNAGRDLCLDAIRHNIYNAEIVVARDVLASYFPPSGKISIDGRKRDALSRRALSIVSFEPKLRSITY